MLFITQINFEWTSLNITSYQLLLFNTTFYTLLVKTSTALIRQVIDFYSNYFVTRSVLKTRSHFYSCIHFYYSLITFRINDRNTFCSLRVYFNVLHAFPSETENDHFLPSYFSQLVIHCANALLLLVTNHRLPFVLYQRNNCMDIHKTNKKDLVFNTA